MCCVWEFRVVIYFFIIGILERLLGDYCFFEIWFWSFRGFWVFYIYIEKLFMFSGGVWMVSLGWGN